MDSKELTNSAEHAMHEAAWECFESESARRDFDALANLAKACGTRGAYDRSLEIRAFWAK